MKLDTYLKMVDNKLWKAFWGDKVPLVRLNDEYVGEIREIDNEGWITLYDFNYDNPDGTFRISMPPCRVESIKIIMLHGYSYKKYGKIY